MSFVILSNISQINNHVIIKDINHHSVAFPISDAIPQKTASASAECRFAFILVISSGVFLSFRATDFLSFRAEPEGRSREICTLAYAMLVINTARSWQPDLSTRFLVEMTLVSLQATDFLLFYCGVSESLFQHFSIRCENYIVLLITIDLGHQQVLRNHRNIRINRRNNHLSTPGIHHAVTIIINHHLNKIRVQFVFIFLIIVIFDHIFQWPGLIDHKWQDDLTIK